MAAGRAGNFGDRGGARRRRNPAQQKWRALHGALRSETNGAVHARRGGAVDLYRSQRGARYGARRRVPGHFAQARGVREEKIAEHVSPVQGAGGRRHHQRPHGSGANVPLRDGRNSRRRGERAEHVAWALRGRGSRRGAAWRESLGRKLAVRFVGLWTARGLGRRAAREASWGGEIGFVANGSCGKGSVATIPAAGWREQNGRASGRERE